MVCAVRVFSVCCERAGRLRGRRIGLEQPQPAPQAPGPAADVLAMCGVVAAHMTIISVLRGESV